jgi:hypothetical protein
MRWRNVSAFLTLAVGAALFPARASADSSADKAVTRASRPVVVTRTSRPVRLLRTWQEPVKGPAGREHVRRVELVFDYAKGVARENYYTADGRPWGEREIKQRQPQPSPEEVAEAKELILRDPELARIVERRAAGFNGGFLLEEARGLPCGPGTRCIQMQLLTPDHSGLLRWTVVDLVRRRIAYPVFIPRGAAR